MAIMVAIYPSEAVYSFEKKKTKKYNFLVVSKLLI